MQLRLLAIYCWFIVRLLLILPALPLIYWLGKKIKAEIPDLPEAALHKKGSMGPDANSSHVLLVGESSIAGVGIDDHMQGIPGSIGEMYGNEGLGFSWQVIARSGFKAIDVIEQLVPQLPDSQADFVILGLGGNDTFQVTPPWRWRKHMKQLIAILRQHYPEATVIVSAMPPVADFPVFPPILRGFMGGQVNMLRLTIQDFPLQFDRLSYFGDKVRMQEWVANSDGLKMEDFFSDGVHPSSLTYRLIGEAIGAEMLKIREVPSNV